MDTEQGDGHQCLLKKSADINFPINLFAVGQ